ncbi:site-specific integrase [Flavisolibacter nicotianae]|uniref:site-specific integrase n=1 Tax=Flavisolibacter nicotianae TaxID=2364882 RepID=UPI000EAE8C3F|nr:site-specific integrase [Flavisolibacter nicotianae]
MLELLTVRFSFLCRTTRTNAEGNSALVLRVTWNRERRDIFTGLYCHKDQWNPKAGRLHRLNKQTNVFNDNLDAIQRSAHEAFNQLKYSGFAFTIDELVSKIKGEDEKPELLMDYLEQEKENLRKRRGVDITPATYDKYRRSATHVQQFLFTEYKIKNYPLARIDGLFLERYFQYLKGTKKISHNVAVKYLTFFKTVLMPAIRGGTVKSDPFRQVKFRKKPVPKDFLTNEEISFLKAVALTPELDRIRNIFLFACYTGLAYCDIKQLSRLHIIRDDDENYHIRKCRQKTGQESIIPLLPVAITILQKYSITGDFRDFRWRVSSNQKMNQRLKLIGEKAGIAKPLHMHLARHTFATTVTLSNGIPIETVSRMLGHASLTQTQHYAKIIATKIKADMSRIKALFS